MEVERELFISGEDVLKRWKGAPFQLVNAMVSGELVAIDLKTGDRFTPDMFGACVYGPGKKCFFCTKPIAWEIVCYTVRALDGKKGYTNPPSFSDERVQVWCDDLRPGLTNEAKTEEKIEKAMESFFYLSEVEAYEQAHGLGPLPHKPETAEALAETLRAAGIEDASMRAKMIKAVFPETKLVELGLLLAGEEKAKDMTPDAAIKNAQRALKTK